MKGLLIKKIALIIATVILSVEVISPVYATYDGLVNKEETVEENTQVTSEQTDYLEQFNNMTEEEKQQLLSEAVKNVEAASSKQSLNSDSDDTGEEDYEVSIPSEGRAVSKDGDRIDWYTDENGEKNFIFNGDEDLTYDASMENAMEGYEYVGTGSKSGMNVFKTTMTYGELDEATEEYEANLKEDEEENEELINWMYRATLSEEELSAALVSADRYTAQVIEENFIYVASISEASGSEAAQKYIEKRRAQALGIDIDDGYTAQVIEENFIYVASISEASGSETAQKYIEKSRVQALGIDIDDEDEGLTATNKASSSEIGSKSSSSETGNKSVGTVLETTDTKSTNNLDGAVANDLTTSSEKKATDSDGLYANNMVGDDWVQITPTENIYTDTIKFDETTIEEYDENGVANGTQQQAQVLIVRDDIVYFQVNQLDENEKLVGGLNGAAVTIKYMDSHNRPQERKGTTARVDEHDGYIAFDNMQGMYDCFINISFPGDATQTYYTLYVSGGNLYTFNMRKVKPGDIYLRAAGIDNVDIMTFGYQLPLFSTAQDIHYNIKYLVDVYDPTNNGAAAPEKVYIVSRPQRPEGWTWEKETDKNKRRKYRDKVFHPDTAMVTIEGQSSREYKKWGPWSQMTHTDRIPEKLPENGDDPKTLISGYAGTRLVADSKTYLRIEESGKTWSETGTDTIELKLTVKKEAPGWDILKSIGINFFGVPNSTGQSSGSIVFNTDIPVLRNAEISNSLLDFRISAAFLPTGQGILGYNAPGPMVQLIDTTKKFAESRFMYFPHGQLKPIGAVARYRQLKEQYIEDKKNMMAYMGKLLKKYNDTDERQWYKKVYIGGVGFAVAHANINWETRKYGASFDAGICMFGTGELTGYAFIGPMPQYCGASAMVSGTVSGGAGFEITKTDQGSYTRLSQDSQIGLDLAFSITGYAGLGIRNFFGAELTGGGNMGFGFHESAYPGAPAVRITGGWEIGLRAYVAFIRWKSTILAKNYQIYPKVNSAESSLASESQLTDFSIVVPEAEGKAVRTYTNDADGGYIETFEASSECNDAGEYTDETQVAKTTELASNVAVATDIRYVSGGKYGGILTRIAYVETECADGKTRTIPRVVWSPVKDTEIEYKTYGVVRTYTPTEEHRFASWELGVEYGYDYSFNVQMVDDNIVDFIIVSGPVDQEERDKKAIEEAIMKGEDPKKAVVKCRVANQHIRAYRFALDQPQKIRFTSEMVQKEDVYNDDTDSSTHDYAYVGAPVSSTFKFNSPYYTSNEVLTTWGACLISMDVFNDQRVSDGYMIANWNTTTGFDYSWVTSKVKVDGDSRTKLLLYGEDNKYTNVSSVQLLSLMSDSNEKLSSKTIENTKWINFEYALEEYITKTYKLEDEIANFSHMNNNSTDLVYFNSGRNLYSLHYSGEVTRIDLKDDKGNGVKLSSADNTLAYLESRRADGSRKINIISISNDEDVEREQPKKGENPNINTDMKIIIYEFTPDGSDKFICKGKNISTIKNKVAMRFDAAFTKKGERDSESSIKVYYMANYKEETVNDTFYESLGEDTEIKTVHEKCDLFVWNWVADYGAKILSMTVPKEVIPYGSKSFNVNITYENIGPKYIDGGVKIEYVLRKGGEDQVLKRVEVDGSLSSGETKSYTLEVEIPKDKHWDGWVTVRAQITEVKANGRWLTSNEAGFKPVWVESDKQKGKITLEGSIKDDYDCKLAISKWASMISKPEHLMVKVYRQKFKDGATMSEYMWESYPSSIILLDSAKTEDYQNYTWNSVFDTTNEKYWYSGMYQNASGTIHVTDIRQKIMKIDYDELVTAVKFELCGLGDDTLNCTYSSVVINNPMKGKLAMLAVDVDDPDALEILSGPGYYTAGSRFDIKYKVHKGYELRDWEIEDPWSLTDISKLGEFSARFNEGYDYAHVTAITVPSSSYYHIKAFVTTDNQGNPHASISAKRRRNLTDIWEDLPASGGSNEYALFMSERLNYAGVRLTATYDKSKYKLVGWYKAEYNATPSEVTYLDDQTSDDKTDVYETYYLPVEGAEPLSTEDTIELGQLDIGLYEVYQIKAVLVPRVGYMVRFDPNGGTLIGPETAETDNNGHLADKDIKNSSASREGHSYDGWYTKDGTKVTPSYTFTEDTTVYAKFSQLPDHELIVMSNDAFAGKVWVNGASSKETKTSGYKGQIFMLKPLPEENQELDSPMWRAYSKDASGNYTVVESLVPKYTAGFYYYTMPDKDIKLVVQFKNKPYSNRFYITLDTDKDELGVSLASYKVSIAEPVEEPAPSIDQIAENRYKIVYGKPMSYYKKYYDVNVSANLSKDKKDKYSFVGWREFYSKPDGTIVYGDIISKDNPIKLKNFNSNDKRLYAEWKKREPQGIRFAKQSVTIEGDFKGGIVNTLIPPTDRKVTYSCSNKSIIAVDPGTGALGTPSNSGSVVITADIAAGGLYSREEATYKLTVNKCRQNISFKKSEMTASLASPSFANELEGAKSEVHYTSSNTAVAKVDYNTGVVTPNRIYGDAVITAVADGNGLYYESKASYTVHITGLEQKISFSEKTKEVTYGDSSFTATPSGARGVVTYSSSDPVVASVNRYTGEVTITGAGTATISATAAKTDRYRESNKAEYTLTVSKADQKLKFATDSMIVTIGDEPFRNSIRGLRTRPHYTSSATQTATVNGLTGTVTIGNEKGDVTIIVNAEESKDYNSSTASYTIKVKGRPQPISFEQKFVRKTYLDEDFTATLSDAKGTVTYKSSRTDIATIDAAGKVHIIKPGQTMITARAAGTSEYEESNIAYCYLNVMKADQELRPESTSISAKSKEIHVNRINGAKTKVVYSSNDGSIATVTESSTGEGWSESRVYAVSAGTAVIEAKAIEDDYYNAATAYYAVEVDRVDTDLHFDRSVVTTITTATAVENYLQNHGGRTVKYSSSDTGIVEVSEVAGKPKEHKLSIKSSGAVVITASVPESGGLKAATASYVLNIRKAPQMMYFEDAIVEVRADSEPFTKKAVDAKTTVKYESLDTTIVEVDATTGDVKLKGIKGEARITATAEPNAIYDEATATYTIKVNGAEQNLEFDKRYVILKYNKEPFIATPSGAKTKVNYYSSNLEVASVDRNTGSVQLIHPGKAMITAIAEANETYNVAIATYGLTINKGTQDPSFEESYVSKRLTDGAFINKLRNAEGEVEYSVSDTSKALVDKTTGEVQMLKVGRVKITATATGSEYYEATERSYQLDIGRGIQTPSFAEAAVSVEYGNNPGINSLNGVKMGNPKYSIAKYEPRSGIQEGEQGATVDPDTGKVTVLNCGTVTIKADIPQTSQYESAVAFYELAIRPKSVTKLAIFVNKDATNPVVVTDGEKILTEGTDYRLRRYEKDRKVVYEVEGIGNYIGIVTKLSESSQVTEIIEIYEPMVSENIPAEKYVEAARMMSKVMISGFDSSKVPVEKIKAAITGEGENKISASDMKRAAEIAVAVNVYVSLESIDDAKGIYKYSLDPYARVLAWMADGTLKSAYTKVEPEWLDGSRTIYVKLGVGNSSKEPSKIVHQTDDGTPICTYTRGDAASGTKFEYDTKEKAVAFYIEHCSDIIIKHEETPTPVPPKPTPIYSGGGGYTGGTSWRWTKDAQGYWHLWHNFHEYKDEWVYAYNEYAKPEKGQSKNAWFSFDEKGRMRTGWFKDKDAKWYYLETRAEGAQGAMYEDCLTPDGYRVDKSGAWNGQPQENRFVMLKQNSYRR